MKHNKSFTHRKKNSNHGVKNKKISTLHVKKILHLNFDLLRTNSALIPLHNSLSDLLVAAARVLEVSSPVDRGFTLLLHGSNSTDSLTTLISHSHSDVVEEKSDE